MNWETYANSKMVETLGWTLLHSIWQVGSVALLLFVILRILKNFSANFRYLVAVFALAFAVVLPVATFLQISNNSSLNFFRAETSKTSDIEKIKPDLRRGEDFSFTVNARVQTPDSQNQTFSITDLQSIFSENFSEALPFVVGIWFFGVMFFAARLAGGARQIRVYKTRGIFAPDDDWKKKFFALRNNLKITQTVKFLQSNLVKTPVVAGFLKPFILVPASLFSQMNPREMETILAHELVHIRRYDPLVNFAQSAIEILFFYHPCAWWISGAIRREREFAADEAVVKILENSEIIYAKALTNLEEIRLRANQNLPPFATAAVNRGNLMQRITKILQEKTETRIANSAWSAMLAFALVSAVLLGVFSFSQTSFAGAQAAANDKKIAVGFVSIPPVDRTANPPKDADATARLLIEKLKSHRVPAIGFLQGSGVSDGEKLFPVRANIARLWRDAGFEIGIGNFRHVWFYDTPYDEYVSGVEKNEAVTKQILAEKNLPLRYFSYPFLNTGKNADERNRFEAWLKTQGITPVKYTIDNQEWMYSYAYDMARNDNDVNTMNEIRAAFLDYMSKMFDHYEAYSREMFGRDIAQTMVLTPSRLVADSADELFGMIERRGYRFVAMDEALSDEAYKTEENFAETQNRIKKSGISWFERWQMARGKKLLDEPRVNATVWKIWNEKKLK